MPSFSKPSNPQSEREKLNKKDILFSRKTRRNTMNSLPRICSLPCHIPSSVPVRVNRRAEIIRCLHSSGPRAAVAHPVTASGPPPKSPVPAASQYGEQIERRRRQSELLKQGRELRKQESTKSALKKRFWKDVHVKEVEGTAASSPWVAKS